MQGERSKPETRGMLIRFFSFLLHEILSLFKFRLLTRIEMVERSMIAHYARPSFTARAFFVFQFAFVSVHVSKRTTIQTMLVTSAMTAIAKNSRCSNLCAIQLLLFFVCFVHTVLPPCGPAFSYTSHVKYSLPPGRLFLRVRTTFPRPFSFGMSQSLPVITARSACEAMEFVGEFGHERGLLVLDGIRVVNGAALKPDVMS